MPGAGRPGRARRAEHCFHGHQHDPGCSLHSQTCPCGLPEAAPMHTHMHTCAHAHGVCALEPPPAFTHLPSTHNQTRSPQQAQTHTHQHTHNQRSTRAHPQAETQTRSSIHSRCVGCGHQRTRCHTAVQHVGTGAHRSRTRPGPELDFCSPCLCRAPVLHPQHPGRVGVTPSSWEGWPGLRDNFQEKRPDARGPEVHGVSPSSSHPRIFHPAAEGVCKTWAVLDVQQDQGLPSECPACFGHFVEEASDAA